MAAWLKMFKTRMENTLWGNVIIALIYALMLLLIFLLFIGEGEFIYEI